MGSLCLLTLDTLDTLAHFRHLCKPQKLNSTSEVCYNNLCQITIHHDTRHQIPVLCFSGAWSAVGEDQIRLVLRIPFVDCPSYLSTRTSLLFRVGNLYYP